MFNQNQNVNYKEWRGKKQLFAVLIIILSVFLASLTVSTIVNVSNQIKEGKYIGKGVKSKNTIAVTASGEVFSKPDLALVNFSVISEAKKPEQALAQNAEKMNKVLDFIKNQGVEAKDLKTTSFNIYPRYEYIGTGYYRSGKRTLAGYEAKQRLEVKIRDFKKIGIIIKGAADSGANQTGNLRFTIDKKDELKNKARKQAIEKAKDKAKKLAAQLDVKLVKIIGFSENVSSPRVFAFEKSGASQSDSVGATPDIETGENKISATVVITYEID